MKMGHLLVAFLLAFTLVSSASTIYVGMEDSKYGDWDRNDVVIKMESINLSIVASGPGSWQPMAGVVLNEDGSPFFDRPSYDGYQKNVGFFMTGTGGFAGSGLGFPASNLQYWGIGTEADNSLLFFSTGPTSGKVETKISALSGSNQVYWGDNSGVHLLFASSALAGATTSFTPDGNFWLKLVNENISVNTFCDGTYFSNFKEVAGVPEPTTAILLGVGFLALGAIHRRRQRKC